MTVMQGRRDQPLDYSPMISTQYDKRLSCKFCSCSVPSGCLFFLNSSKAMLLSSSTATWHGAYAAFYKSQLRTINVHTGCRIRTFDFIDELRWNCSFYKMYRKMSDINKKFSLCEPSLYKILQNDVSTAPWLSSSGPKQSNNQKHRQRLTTSSR